MFQTGIVRARHFASLALIALTLGASYPIGAPKYTRATLVSDVFVEQAAHRRESETVGLEAGLRYQLFFDDRTLDGDLFREFHGLKVGVDRMSAPYLHGAVIDFVDTIEKQGFTIDNPNAGGSCACGESFH